MNRLQSLRSVLCAAAAALLAAGCASVTPETQAQGGQAVCRQEVRTGSLRPTTSCRSAEDIRRDEEEANRTLSGPRPTSSSTGSTGR
jgi:hypothetical protein